MSLGQWSFLPLVTAAMPPEQSHASQCATCMGPQGWSWEVGPCSFTPTENQGIVNPAAAPQHAWQWLAQQQVARVQARVFRGLPAAVGTQVATEERPHLAKGTTLNVQLYSHNTARTLHKCKTSSHLAAAGLAFRHGTMHTSGQLLCIRVLGAAP